MKRSPDLLRLADTVLLPGFAGTTAPDWVRRRLFDARQHFTDALVAEVAHSLHPATPEALAEELTELELLDYCREALARWSGA